MKVLWFIDRFGLPGSYYRIWTRLVAENDIQPSDIRVVSLHKQLNRQLLTKFGTRKAPTWIPEEGPRITWYIDQCIQVTKPKAVVLASPESLACIGLAPEHATLHNLRGSVYWRSGIPHLVMLPMSAWNSLVSQKEIGAANYGFESQEAFSARIEEGASDGVGASDSSHSNRRSGATGIGSTFKMVRSGDGTDSRRTPSGLPFEVRSPSHSLHRDSEHGDGERGADDGGRSIRLAEVRDDSSGVAAGDAEVDDNGVSEDDVPSDLDGHDESASVDDASDESESEVTGDGDDERHVDQFFYEPILSPVGRFVLTADVMKLRRLLDSGKRASGPKAPIVLQWR